MLEDTQSSESAGGAASDEAPGATEAKKAPAKKAAAKKAPAKKATAKKAPAKKATAKKASAEPPAAEEMPGEAAPAKKAVARKSPAKKTSAKTTAKSGTGKPTSAEATDPAAPVEAAAGAPATDAAKPAMLLFQPPDPTKAAPRRTRKAAAPAEEPQDRAATEDAPAPDRKKPAAKDPVPDQPVDDRDQENDRDRDDDEGGEGGGNRRRRRRGGRRRRKPGEGESETSTTEESDEPAAGRSQQSGDADQDDAGDGSTRRRRRRRRAGEEGDDGSDNPENTVTRVRKTRSAEDQITAISGSTRLEAKKQRRRDGREAGRRRAPIVSEAEFLARRESVDRVMVIRQREDLTQIGVLEDKVLVEHYVARESQISLIGNVYLGRVQNVLPSMEAAFIDIGKGRNAVLYAGEVNWSALGHKDGAPRKIESVLTSGQPILVQVTKDPIGNKGARLTSQISLAGRFLVYVPDGTTSGISRKLPDTERSRLKALLKEIVPDTAGVIVRTAAEGASEEELTRDVERLKARWEDIEAKTKGNAPQLLYGEPDLTLKVVRDLFTEDFTKLVIEGDDAWDTVQGYVQHVAPDLEERLEKFNRDDHGKDIFATYRVDEQIAKGLDRKVWLPSGGSLIIDRTEAMTVVDVNTGKFTGSGGNLEETVTKNNLEAAEEMVRQLRLRDIGGIIVIDFIDMVLESNRDLVLRRLVECLGRDRTRHQVAEVTSLGLVQMTRKRIGTGLVESFSENCENCQGRGVVIKDAPVDPKRPEDDSQRGGRRGRGGRGRGDDDANGRGGDKGGAKPALPSPKDIAAVAKAENADKPPADAPVEPEKAQPEPVEPPEKPEVVTRSRRRSASRPAGATTQAQPVDQPADQPVAEATPAQAEPEPVALSPVAEPPVASPDRAPEPPEKPQVVTRARRRSASRPAGATTPQPEPIVPQVVAPVAASPAPEAPVEKPHVVTRTRGRSASRPAGPPAGATDGVPSEAPSDATTIEHVPVKKKGARKR